MKLLKQMFKISTHQNLFDEIRSICHLDIASLIGVGNIASGAFLLTNGDVFKIYQTTDREFPITEVAELDITSRLTHPSVAKTKRIVTREECPLTKPDPIYGMRYFNHGLIMNYVECNMSVDLRKVLNGIIGTIMLLENNIVHADYGPGNQCFTEDAYTIIDLNNDIMIPYNDSRIFLRKTQPLTLRKSIVESLQIKGGVNFINYYRGIGPKPKSIETDVLELTPFQHQLYYDLAIRLYSPDIDKSIDIYEIPTHPLFKGIPYIPGSEEPRYTNFNDWPARHFDYFSPLRNVIADIITNYDFIIIEVLESIDLYYRYLPFIQSSNQLTDAIWNCFHLVTDRINPNKQNIRVSDQIVNNLNGRIKPRWIYHKCRSLSDYIICWQLMTLPYDQYMRLNPIRFYELVEPSYDQEDMFNDLVEKYPNPENHLLMPNFNGNNLINLELVNQLSFPANLNVPEVFSKLTTEELIEFLDLYKVSYPKPNKNEYRFYLADLAKRTYIYLFNRYGDKLTVTWPVLDLLHLSKLNLTPTQQYPLEFLLNMNQTMVNSFAVGLKLDPNQPNVRERCIRILRMMYLIPV